MDTLFLAHFINALLMIALPLAVGWWLGRRFKLGWRLFWIGAATFILSQVGHIPFNAGVNQLFLRGVIPTPSRDTLLFVVNLIFGGLSAGLFEELTRTAVFRWWAKDARTWRKGVHLGAGHEGGEALAFGVIVLLTFVQMAALRDADLSRMVSAAQLPLVRQQVTSYWSAPVTLSLLGAFERLLTFPIQISLSLLVMQAFTRRRAYWVGLAILWHAVVDAAAVFFTALWRGQAWSPYAVEGVVLVFSLLSLGIIAALYQPEPPAEAAQVTAAPALALPVLDDPPSAEKLDESKYV